MPKYNIYKISNESGDECIIDKTIDTVSLADEQQRHNIGGTIEQLYELVTDCNTDVDIAVSFFQFKHSTFEQCVIGERACKTNAQLFSAVMCATVEFNEPHNECIEWIFKKLNKNRPAPPNTTKVSCSICGFSTMQKNLKRHQKSKKCVSGSNNARVKANPQDKVECIYCGFLTHQCNLKRHQHSRNCKCISLMGSD
jgi:hypothetical protein